MNVFSSWKRTLVAVSAVSALSLTALAASAQDATPAPPAASADAVAPVSRPILGVRLLDSEAGVTVAAVVAGSPAETAGIAVDDVIVAVNGVAVDSAQAVVEALSAFVAGDTVTLDVQRGAEALTLDAVLGSSADFGFGPGNAPDMGQGFSGDGGLGERGGHGGRGGHHGHGGFDGQQGQMPGGMDQQFGQQGLGLPQGGTNGEQSPFSLPDLPDSGTTTTPNNAGAGV